MPVWPCEEKVCRRSPPPAKITLLQSPKRTLRESASASPRTPFPRLAPRASGHSVPLRAPAIPDQQHPPASKPEAQAEGVLAACTPNPIPSARGSGFKGKGMGSAQHISDTRPAFTLLQSPKRKLRESSPLAPRTAFPRLAARASRSSVPCSSSSKAASRGSWQAERRVFTSPGATNPGRPSGK